ncbi:phage/plasmid primase, P4 family [Fluviibacterium sp. DFM31]|uniref:Phage/plasmid primase, P4 family n=1 Tax=Meridianimarinicoccus marinus TaxID=3231483 RepID=A0ABV3L567_9RHOB
MTPPALNQARPAIEPEAISTFCDTVFGYLEGCAPVRLLSETGTRDTPGRFHFPNADELAPLLINVAAQAAEEHRAVYVVPSTVASPGSARAEDIIQTGVILIDLDHGDIDAKRDHASRHLGAPSLEVASGGVTGAGQIKRHLYWRLTEAAVGNDLTRIAALRGLLADKLGGDTSFKSLHQPIRVPGTIHGKNGILAPVKIIACTRREYDLSELEGAGAQMPPLVGGRIGIDTGSVQKPGPDARTLAITPVHAEGVDGLTRFEAISKVIGHWIRLARRQGCTLDQAWEAVRDHNAAMIRPPWPEPRLHREFEALRKRDAKQHGPFPSDRNDAANDVAHPVAGNSEDALADRFAAAHSQGWKFVAAWGAWFQWSGQVWTRDGTGAVRELARQICRVAAAECDKPGDARRIASEKTIMACLRIAASDPRIATRPSDWDAHSMLLNTPSGVIDLETGEVIPCDPALMITQITAVAPGGDCPRWTAFLDEITDSDGELISYLARLAGYCLTGSTQEHMFAFLHGDGANGKSVFLSALAHVLADYAATSTLETFMASRASRHLTELAGLKAARLVIVPETEQGHSWAEARIKTVTGGENIRANFMRHDHFEFRRQFKLVIAGNHRPQLAGHGEAMRRRLHLVPFEVTIPPDQRDPQLTRTLREESAGILRWMLAGCAEWLRVGLRPPRRVRDAGDEYFDQEDLVGQWVTECCSEGPGQQARSKALFASWKCWAEDAAVPPGSIKTFGEAMRLRGHSASYVNRSRGWKGIGLSSARPGAGDGQ